MHRSPISANLLVLTVIAIALTVSVSSCGMTSGTTAVDEYPFKESTAEYVFTTNVEEPYRFTNSEGNFFRLPINTIYKDRITEYMGNAFADAGQTNPDAEYRIDMRLVSFEIDQNQQPNFAEPFSGQGHTRLELTIQTMVSVSKDGQELQRKTLTTRSRFNQELSNTNITQDYYEESIDRLMVDYVKMFNRFLNSLDVEEG